MAERVVACLTWSVALSLAAATSGPGQRTVLPVPAASDPLTLWVGDTVRVGPARDPEAGASPMSAHPAWSSADSSVATVLGDAVVGAGAGATRVTLHLESRVLSLDVVVLPVLLGRVFAPARDAVSGLRATVRAGGRRDSADVSPAGAFAVRLSAPALGDIELAVDAAAPGERRYHPVLVRLAARELTREVRVVLVPAAWAVTSGRYAGRTVRVSAAAALRRTGDRSRFWRIEQALSSARVVGWPQELFPLPVAFRREEGGAIGAADSAAFWAVLDSLEGDIGADLFRPAQYEDVRGHKDGIVVEVDRELTTAGLTLAAWNAQGRIFGATVSFKTARLLGDAHVATHEMMHALGFGHTGSWPSVMGTGSHRPSRPTPEDVAHVQLLLRVLDAQRVHDAAYGILNAEEGERRLGRHWDRDARGGEPASPRGP